MKEKLAKVVGYALGFLIPCAIIAGVVAFISFILMLLWNGFLVPALGLAAISLWQAGLGFVLINFVTMLVMNAQSFFVFIQSNIMMILAQRRFNRQNSPEDSLLKHFRHFQEGGQHGKDS